MITRGSWPLNWIMAATAGLPSHDEANVGWWGRLAARRREKETWVLRSYSPPQRRPSSQTARPGGVRRQATTRRGCQHQAVVGVRAGAGQTTGSKPPPSPGSPLKVSPCTVVCAGKGLEEAGPEETMKNLLLFLMCAWFVCRVCDGCSVCAVVAAAAEAAAAAATQRIRTFYESTIRVAYSVGTFFN
jgi:hypothetical protein